MLSLASSAASLPSPSGDPYVTRAINPTRPPQCSLQAESQLFRTHATDPSGIAYLYLADTPSFSSRIRSSSLSRDDSP